MDVGLVDNPVHLNVPPSTTTPEVQTKPVVEDPKAFFEGFRKSSWYKKAYDERQRRLPNANASEEDKIRVFEQQNEAKEALLAYTQQDVTFHYNPEYYPKEATDAISVYVEHVKEMTKLQRSGSFGKDQMISLDTLRRGYHQDVADALTQAGISSNTGLGKKLAQLILIEKGLETHQQAGVPDEKKLQNMLA